MAEKKTPAEMGALLSAGLMAEYMPTLLDEIKDELNTKVIEYIGKNLEGREISHDIKTEFTTSGDKTSGEIQIDLGPIKGEHEESVRGYRRKGKQVKGHRRTLKNKGTFKDGLYHYSFCINTDRNEYQPSGAMNMSKYNKIIYMHY